MPGRLVVSQSVRERGPKVQPSIGQAMEQKEKKGWRIEGRQFGEVGSVVV